MQKPIDESAVVDMLQQIWRLRLSVRQQQQVNGEVQARQRARHSEQVRTALQRYHSRFDSQR